jgi:hypothetical protein
MLRPVSEPLRFTARLHQEEDGPGVFFEVPADLRAHFGRARPPVLVTLRAHTWRSTPAVYGGRTYLVVSRANREAAGVEPGEELEVTLNADEAPRTVAVPDDLAAALADDPVAAERFAAMSFSHRREYVDWIAEAKRPDTRARRIARTLERVREGRPQR